MNIGKRIKELRSAKGVTQTELAQRIGMTASAISSYEIGERQPSYDVLIKVAKQFNVTTDYLLGHTNKDMMDVSGLCRSQRENIQKMVATYQKFNELSIIMFDMERDEYLSDSLENSYGASFDTFKADLDRIVRR
ncbi:MAG: helix-turn-helix domain-containing protein [Defluviitaleaceae bacterium]|nr:helix-turn-helix domain-containing protein [Defluviitaleaceae bacterium]